MIQNICNFIYKKEENVKSEKKIPPSLSFRCLCSDLLLSDFFGRRFLVLISYTRRSFIQSSSHKLPPSSEPLLSPPAACPSCSLLVPCFPHDAAFSPSSQPWRAQAPPSSSAAAAALSLSLMPSSAAPPCARAAASLFPSPRRRAPRSLLARALPSPSPNSAPLWRWSPRPCRFSTRPWKSQPPSFLCRVRPELPPSSGAICFLHARVRDSPAAGSSRTWAQSMYARSADLNMPLGLGTCPLGPSHRMLLNHRWIGFLLPLARLPGTSVPLSPWLRACASLFGCRCASSSVGLTSRRCPIRASPRPWSYSSSSPTLCCRFDCRRCCVPRCMLAGCRLLSPALVLAPGSR
jgi:hypothetical protein